MIKLSLLVAGARAWAPPEVHEAIKDVVFSGGLANPLTEFEDARWEHRIGALPHERLTNLRSFDEEPWIDAGSTKNSSQDAPCASGDTPCDVMPAEFSW
jgi:hypothetical protein